MGIVEITPTVVLLAIAAALALPAVLATVGAIRRRGAVGPTDELEPLASWHITPAAAEHYVRLQRWPDDDEHRNRAFAQLAALVDGATYRSADTLFRQLWRVERPERLRMVVALNQGDPTLRRVVWVGRGRPPPWAWKPSA